ncbi:XRE family transcriptional regulator [Brevibacterium sp. 91QC2O2]|uniref:helix-turn-helix domain-containing protein n=1 Tax=Brevibacterium sp. 91QC2O2 TaxID=2968458 RepID=UPI00211B7F29|nr:XRE family transcriptional regulator [Brevibacterium sp. 91QC2O2]MCQ9368100.1 XRE family transcriptional regulator [Brevibacterium sp. 91QC2O2]
MDATIDEALTGIGTRLKAARTAKNLTLAEVGHSTHISASTLSRLESGERKATLELLLPLSRLYHVPLDDLVGGPPLTEARVNPRRANLPGETVTALAHADTPLRIYRHILRPAESRRVGARADLRMHTGHEWLYVVAGSLWLRLGPRTYTLTAGQAVQFDGRTAHALGNERTDDTAEYLSLYSRAGERTHVPPFTQH